MSTTVRFTDFWKDSDKATNNFFVPFIEAIYQDSVIVVRDPTARVDLEIVSVFGKRPSVNKRVSTRLQKMISGDSVQSFPESNTNANKRIWFTGENKRPPLTQGFDSYLCFEPEGFINNVHYLPLWVLNLDNFGKGPSHGFNSAEPFQDKLTKPRNLNNPYIEKSKFCCAFISNPVSFRMGLLRDLNEIETVEVFGKVVNNPIDDKLLVTKNFRFSIAFENNIYPGYVTEKLLESYTCDTIPVYWGDDREKYFNPQAFVNLYDFSSFQEFRDQLEIINLDQERYEFMYTQPLLLKPFDLEGLIQRVRNDLF